MRHAWLLEVLGAAAGLGPPGPRRGGGGEGTLSGLRPPVWGCGVLCALSGSGVAGVLPELLYVEGGTGWGVG